MASIYYSILYPPKLPIDLPSFELGKPEDTWRLYLEPSVGNKPSDFKGGFIRIRNSNTEKNALYPGTGGYLDGFLPFRNPFANRLRCTILWKMLVKNGSVIKRLFCNWRIVWK